MRVLVLTYPLTPVTPAACGGTEQMACLLLRHCSRQPDFSLTWLGAPHSQAWPGISFVPWDVVLGDTWSPHAPPETAACWQRALDSFIACGGWDLIHNDGAYSFVLDGGHAPVLFTLHLARELYPESVLLQPGVHFHCVSRTQHALYGARACCGSIGNGIDLEQFAARPRPAARDAPLLYLGRMCPEKAPHAAIAVARHARRRLWLVGAVGPFAAHQNYFRDRIAPELDGSIRWFPPPPLEHKRALFAAAAAVLIPSRIAETSSVVAMEAAASGVPVLATPCGALPEIVAGGETGWLGRCEDWPAWIPRLHEIDPRACRRRAERCFSAQRMAAAYTALYRCLAAGVVH